MTSVPLPTSLPRLTHSEAIYEPAPEFPHRVRWLPYTPSPIMARAHQFEHGEPLTLDVAKRALLAAYDAETTPIDRWELRARALPRHDGTSTFRINYERVESDRGKSTASLGISDETALEYMACDYINHRINGGVVARIPALEITPALSDMLTAVNERMDALHLDLLSFIVK
jgi:hypothetical protein